MRNARGIHQERAYANVTAQDPRRSFFLKRAVWQRKLFRFLHTCSEPFMVFKTLR